MPAVDCTRMQLWAGVAAKSSKPILPRLIQRPQKRREVANLGGVERGFAGMLVLGKDFFQRRGATVVQERTAMADAAERRRIELRVSLLVLQANVVRIGRSIGR